MDASDRRQVRAAEKRARFFEVQRAEFLKAALSTESGRIFFWGLLERAHIFETSFSEDELRMAFLEGERNAGIRLLDEILRVCPDKFVMMMQENNARSQENVDRTEQPDADAEPDAGTE